MILIETLVLSSTVNVPLGHMGDWTANWFLVMDTSSLQKLLENANGPGIFLGLILKCILNFLLTMMGLSSLLYWMMINFSCSCSVKALSLGIMNSYF